MGGCSFRGCPASLDRLCAGFPPESFLVQQQQLGRPHRRCVVLLEAQPPGSLERLGHDRIRVRHDRRGLRLRCALALGPRQGLGDDRFCRRRRRCAWRRGTRIRRGLRLRYRLARRGGRRRLRIVRFLFGSEIESAPALSSSRSVRHHAGLRLNSRTERANLPRRRYARKRHRDIAGHRWRQVANLPRGLNTRQRSSDDRGHGARSARAGDSTKCSRYRWRQRADRTRRRDPRQGGRHRDANGPDSAGRPYARETDSAVCLRRERASRSGCVGARQRH